MEHINTRIQKIKKRSRQFLMYPILMHWRGLLAQKKWRLVLALLGGLALGGIVLKLTLGKPNLVTLQGEVMGTPYYIQYLDRWGRNYQEEIESLLERLYHDLSTVLPDSELARFNAHNCSDFYFESPFFYPLITKSKEIYRNTEGAFDPTILPLVNAWKDNAADTAELDGLLVHTVRAHVSLDYIVANTQRVKKLKEEVKLDFGGILKGYAVDKIVDLLHACRVECMWILLGSEAMARGKPNKRKAWRMAIHPHVPFLVDTEIMLKLENKAVAISSKRGEELHNQHPIIDPTTGYPAQNTLLAAVVVGEDCKTVDAYATAMRVRGLDFAQTLLAQQEDLAAFLIYENDQGKPAFYASPSLHMQHNKHNIILQLTQKTP